MTAGDFERLRKLTHLIFNHAKWDGTELEAQDLALAIIKAFNL